MAGQRVRESQKGRGGFIETHGWRAECRGGGLGKCRYGAFAEHWSCNGICDLRRPHPVASGFMSQ
eukprot:1000865-Rhodomonas_salina.1